mgnify:CR=1 FL=1
MKLSPTVDEVAPLIITSPPSFVFSRIVVPDKIMEFAVNVLADVVEEVSPEITALPPSVEPAPI